MARQLVKEQLVSCAHVLPAAISIYKWEGEIQENEEHTVILKVSEKKVPQILEKIKDIHEYEVPCILVIDVEDGYEPFIQWVEGH